VEPKFERMDIQGDKDMSVLKNNYYDALFTKSVGRSFLLSMVAAAFILGQQPANAMGTSHLKKEWNYASPYNHSKLYGKR
jgi:hypothetical protein